MNNTMFYSFENEIFSCLKSYSSRNYQNRNVFSAKFFLVFFPCTKTHLLFCSWLWALSFCSAFPTQLSCWTSLRQSIPKPRCSSKVPSGPSQNRDLLFRQPVFPAGSEVLIWYNVNLESSNSLISCFIKLPKFCF